MASYVTTIVWKRGFGENFTDNRFSRAHGWFFDGGIEITASSSPHIVPVPLSKEAAVDPEEAFIAAIASCHMLWFLSLAAGRGLIVESYIDHAEGGLSKNDCGMLAITDVTLRPAVLIGPTKSPSPSQIDELHNLAHEKCFIANSVKTNIRVVPQ